MATPFGSQPGESAGCTYYRKLRWCWYQATTPRGRRPPPTRVRICLRGPLAGLGTASLTLYFAVTYTIQRLILQAKAQRIANSPRQDVSDPGARTPSW
jgi:hypothetical protein